MRFMVIVKSTPESEQSMPTEAQMIEMGKLNAELQRAGVWVTGEGLLSSAKGAKVRFDGSERTVVDGPFTEAKELIGGFWILQVKTRADVIEWVKRIPFTEGEVEVRQIGEAADYADAVSTDEGRAVLAAEAASREPRGS